MTGPGVAAGEVARFHPRFDLPDWAASGSGYGSRLAVQNVSARTVSDACRSAAQLLLELADLEDDLAEAFERLAATGGPQHRERRTALAREARAGAARARFMVDDFGNGHPRLWETNPDTEAAKPDRR